MNSDLYESALLRLSLILTPLLTGRPEEPSVKECLNDLRQALHEPVDWGTELNGPLLLGRNNSDCFYHHNCICDDGFGMNLSCPIHKPLGRTLAPRNTCPHCKGEGCVEGGSAEVHGAPHREYLPCPAGCTPPWEER